MSQVFVRSNELKDLIFDAKLRINEWKILFAIDGEKDYEAIANFLELPASDVSTTLDKLKDMQFVAPLDIAATALEDIAEPETVVAAPEVEEVIEMPEPEIEAAPEVEEVIEPEAAVEEAAPQEAAEVSDETDDLDELIGNLLDEEAQSVGTASEDVLDALDGAESDAPVVEDDFDLGSIFQEDENGAAPSFDDLVSEATAEAVEEVAPPADEATAVDVATAQTILVVDDSVVIRKMVEIALENESYNIISVATGKEALSYLDENTPDIIILDIMLSDVNGLDVLKAIKASKQIPVVMLSAKDTPRETSKAKQLGADDFIPKPFKDEELVGKIKELIKQ